MRRLALILFLVFPVRLISQPFIDLLNIKYQYFPYQYFKSSQNKKTAFELDVNVMIPLVQKDSSTVLAGMFYKNIQANDLQRSFKLNSSGLYLGYEYKWKYKRWNTTVIFIPKLNSDGYDFTKRNLQFGGVVLFKFRKSTQVQYNFGLYYNRELFGNYFIPLIGINWKATGRLNIFGNLPNNFNIEYRINSALYTGLAYSSFTSTFALHDENNLFVSEGYKYTGYSQFRLFLHWYLREKVVLFFESGFTHKRLYSLYNSSAKISMNVPGAQSKIDDGCLFVAGFAYRIRLDK